MSHLMSTWIFTSQPTPYSNMARQLFWAYKMDSIIPKMLMTTGPLFWDRVTSHHFLTWNRSALDGTMESLSHTLRIQIRNYAANSSNNNAPPSNLLYVPISLCPNEAPGCVQKEWPRRKTTSTSQQSVSIVPTITSASPQQQIGNKNKY